MRRVVLLLLISTFGTGSKGGVLPAHESSNVVYPMLLEERTAGGELVLQISGDLVLNLKKSSVAAPLLRVISTENGKDVTSFLNGKDIEASIYHDAKAMASVSITRLGSGVEVEGLISPEKRIEPVHGQARSEIGGIPHVIHAIDTGGVHDDVIYNHRIYKPGQITARSSSATEKAPESVQAEIFVISDTYHSRFFKNKTKLILYVCMIVNTVNIRLLETSHPQIQLLFTGLEVSVNEPYLNYKGDVINAEETLQNLGRYTYAVRDRLGYPDTLFLLTGRDAYGIRRGRPDRTLRGLGYDNGICTQWFAALGEDTPGTFSGVDTFGHEVGHLLGASHDGQPYDRRYPGRPGAEGCPFSYGYLMAYAKRGPISHHYSHCSLAQMKFIVTARGSSCWRVIAKETYNITKKYPGMIMSTTKYCQRKFATMKNVSADPSPYFKSTCTVRCFYSEYQVSSNGQLLYKDLEALEYTPCGHGQVCIQGACTTSPIQVTWE